MKRLIALVLGLALLLACAAAVAETAEKESLGILKVNKSFDIRYNPLPDDYTISIYKQDDMTICANIESPKATLPRMGLVIAFNDQWAEVERLNDVSEEDLEPVMDTFRAEYGEPVFDTKETAYGTKLLLIMSPTYQDAYIYTIYRGHEIEIHLIPGTEQEKLSDGDVDRVVTFLSDMDFDPVEE